MSLSPGDPAIGGDIAESRPGTDTVDAGDAVMFANGEMAPGDDADVFGGIARHDGNNDGRGNTALLHGVTVANVHTDDPDGAVVEGALLNLSPEPGALYRDYETDTDGNVTGYNPGPVLALSDEGGQWHGENRTYDVPDGYAVVYVRRSHA